jgi:O-antigen/teichoic acid export membrane protein
VKTRSADLARNLHSRVARNTLLNLAGLGVPLALAFFVMPIAARVLGPTRFGIIGLAWAITEYLALFDLGLGRATVKFVADAMHRDRNSLADVISLSTLLQVGAGLLGGAVFALLAPTIARSAFHVPLPVLSEAIGVFRVVGFSLPIVLLGSALRGILEGAQRFDLSTTLRMLSGASSVAMPAIGAVEGVSLPTIMWWVLLARVAVCAVYVLAIRRALPDASWHLRVNWRTGRPLLSFGGWVLVSNAVSPLLVYFDRFALGNIAGVAAVGFYTAPYEGVSRLLLVAVSLALSLLPALTALEAHGERTHSKTLMASAARTLALVLIPPLALIGLLAPQLLTIWLGSSYAAQSATAVRILSAGVFANAMAQLPLVNLYAVDRPDLPAKCHLIELVVHIPLTVLLIRSFAITGAALAWTTRVLLDLSLLVIAWRRTQGRPSGWVDPTIAAAQASSQHSALFSAAGSTKEPDTDSNDYSKNRD